MTGRRPADRWSQHRPCGAERRCRPVLAGWPGAGGLAQHGNALQEAASVARANQPAAEHIDDRSPVQRHPCSTAVSVPRVMGKLTQPAPIWALICQPRHSMGLRARLAARRESLDVPLET